MRPTEDVIGPDVRIEGGGMAGGQGHQPKLAGKGKDVYRRNDLGSEPDSGLIVAAQLIEQKDSPRVPGAERQAASPCLLAAMVVRDEPWRGCGRFDSGSREW